MVERQDSKIDVAHSEVNDLSRTPQRFVETMTMLHFLKEIFFSSNYILSLPEDHINVRCPSKQQVTEPFKAEKKQEKKEFDSVLGRNCKDTRNRNPLEEIHENGISIRPHKNLMEPNCKNKNAPGLLGTGLSPGH